MNEPLIDINIPDLEVFNRREFICRKCHATIVTEDTDHPSNDACLRCLCEEMGIHFEIAFKDYILL